MIDFVSNFKECPQHVPEGVYAQIVKVESSGNPFAIGVVNGRLERQPNSLAEAVATALSLHRQGFNFSVGISQINKQHFTKFGWSDNLARAFDVCENVKASKVIFGDCEKRASLQGYLGENLTRASLSCYYSGSFERGTRLGYTDKVLAQGGMAQVKAPEAIAIAVHRTGDNSVVRSKPSASSVTSRVQSPHTPIRALAQTPKSAPTQTVGFL